MVCRGKPRKQARVPLPRLSVPPVKSLAQHLALWPLPRVLPKTSVSRWITEYITHQWRWVVVLRWLVSKTSVECLWITESTHIVLGHDSSLVTRLWPEEGAISTSGRESAAIRYSTKPRRTHSAAVQSSGR